MSEPTKQFSLPRFKEAVTGCDDPETNEMKRWRYTNGRLPRFAVWLIEHPRIAEALAEDARQIAESTEAQS